MCRSFRSFSLALQKGLIATKSDREKTDAVGRVLADHLPVPEFMHDCIERALLAMESGRTRWRNPPIDSDVEAGYVVRMIYWPARYRSDIHRHNLWTVTGVLYNSIEVVVYDDAGLVEKARYGGAIGAIGKVVPPCVHAAENNTDVPSVTLAVFCRQPAHFRCGPEVEWITTTEESKYAAGAYDRALRSFVFMMDNAPTHNSLALLDKVYDLARPPLKLLSIKAIAQLDPQRAMRRLEELKHIISDPEQKERVTEVYSTLKQALSL